MKRKGKSQIKLSQQDFERMWGEDSPYSQVNITEQIRILDDRVSRTFLVVETEINPFTFEFAQKSRSHFIDDIPALQLLDHAENRGKFGYVASVGEVELLDEESRAWARTQADMAIKTIIRLHALVIDTFNLKHAEPTGIIHDVIPSDARYIWNEHAGGLEIVGQELWDTKKMVGASAGAQNNKMRSFFVLVHVKNFDFKKKLAIAFANLLKKVSAQCNVEIEDVESSRSMFLSLHCFLSTLRQRCMPKPF